MVGICQYNYIQIVDDNYRLPIITKISVFLSEFGTMRFDCAVPGWCRMGSRPLSKEKRIRKNILPLWTGAGPDRTGFKKTSEQYFEVAMIIHAND